MISFHPTVSIITYLKAITSLYNTSEISTFLSRIFPQKKALLTDSGRSAFALALESLNLSGKRLILPSFLCNVLLPILSRYNIKPIFIDVDERTYQPKKESYTNDLLEKADAVLLVATFGTAISKEIINFLKQQGKIVITDYAHCNMPENPVATMLEDARFYSLPKTIPVPDGGLIVFNKHIHTAPLNESRHSVSIKNWLKLFKLPNFLIGFLKHVLKHGNQKKLSWESVYLPSRLTKRLFSYYIAYKKLPRREKVGGFSYCYPLQFKSPDKEARKNAWKGIIAERMWHDPIVLHKEAKKKYGVSIDSFSHTKKLSENTLCFPLWHKNSISFLKKNKQRISP